MNTAAETARLRQGFYRFFAGALAPPMQARLAELVSAADLLEDMGPSQYGFYQEWRALVDVLHSGVLVADVAPEHVRLFASGAKDVLCPPHESYYRSHGRREAIAGIAAAIEADYSQLGISVADSTDPPDHATTQLEIMSTLCAREFAAWEMDLPNEAGSLLESQGTFLRNHLAFWLPLLRSRLLSAGPHAYYAASMDAVHAFVLHDQDLIFQVRRWTGAVA